MKSFFSKRKSIGHGRKNIADLDNYLGHRSGAVNRVRAESLMKNKNLSHEQKRSVIDFVMEHPARFTNQDDRFIGRLIARFWNKEGKQ